MERIITYIDGFNLYFGLRDRGWQRYYWLDMCKLSENILLPDQQLVHTKYFTSRIANPPAKRKRQSNYLEALGTLSNLTIYYGHYQHYPHRCRNCGNSDIVPHEKMTDVNIAVELLTDAFQDNFDTALLVSADSDLIGPIQSVKRLFPHKRVVVGFPPARVSGALRREASACFSIGRGKIAGSLLPLQIQKPDGYILSCPQRWR